MTIGEKIAGLRKEHGMTQVYLANRLDVSSQFLNMVESGRKRPPIWMIARLSEVFCVTTDEIIKS